MNSIAREEKDLAAALLLAIECGALSMKEAVTAVDREIGAAPVPSMWLIDASLAKEAEDVLGSIRRTAAGHPMLADPWAVLDAMDLAIGKGASVMDVAACVKRIYPYGQWPRELEQVFYDLYEELTCAHEHGNVPQPALIEKALRALLAAARGKSVWRPALERVTT